MIIYTLVSAICIALLLARRYIGFFGKAELGGPPLPKWGSALFLVFLWFVYVLLSSLQAYEYL